MKDQLKLLEIIHFSVTAFLFICFVYFSVNSYINDADKTFEDYSIEQKQIVEAILNNGWTEKCTKYEYYEEHELYNNISSFKLGYCQKIYYLCGIDISYTDKVDNCDYYYDRCLDNYGSWSIKTINKSYCVETMLVKADWETK